MISMAKESPMKELTYRCSVCGKEVKAAEGKPAPVCCNKPMEPLPFCTNPETAETARNYNADEPCADGSTKRKR
jgi:hypothetical protein